MARRGRYHHRRSNPSTLYQVAKLGSLDAIHLATADPFRAELTDFVTYDSELSTTANDLGFPVIAPA